MKLYFSSGACSMASHIALQESGLKYSTESVDLSTMQLKAGGDFNKINPKGYVPALELENGDLLTEGAVILTYIADKVPEKNLIPKSGMERYRCQEWLTYIATEIHKGFGPLFAKNPPEIEEQIKAGMSKKFDYLSHELKGKSFLMGNTYTVADAYLFTILNWSNYVKFDLTKWPVLMGYVEKVKSRPATMEILKTEDLL